MNMTKDEKLQLIKSLELPMLWNVMSNFIVLNDHGELNDVDIEGGFIEARFEGVVSHISIEDNIDDILFVADRYSDDLVKSYNDIIKDSQKNLNDLKILVAVAATIQKERKLEKEH